jgi:hypothetical protein
MTPTNEDLLALADRADSWNRCYPGNLNVELLVADLSAALRVLVAERQAIRDKALDAILADDELCLRLAEGYDREDAAQRGEPNPHSMGEDGYSEWALGRVSCAKEGLRAAIRAMKGTTE